MAAPGSGNKGSDVLRRYSAHRPKGVEADEKIDFGSLALDWGQSGGTRKKTRIVTCHGILIEVDMKAGADFPMAVVYDNRDEANPHTRVLDLGHAGHWPLRGACWVGETCMLMGPYFKKIGNTYYLRVWNKAEAPGHKD
jgi:hypothetical protein